MGPCCTVRLPGSATARRPRARLRAAFTLIEILMVVLLLGVLAAAVIIPALARYSEDAKASAFAANLKHFAERFQVHAQMFGRYPAEVGPGVFPPEMVGELDAAAWAALTPAGGQWDWDYQQFGFGAGVSVDHPDLTDAQMTGVDEVLDDGDLSTGCFQRRPDGYIFVLSD